MGLIGLPSGDIPYTVESRDPETTFLPSGKKATDMTQPEWPFRGLIGLPGGDISPHDRGDLLASLINEKDNTGIRLCSEEFGNRFCHVQRKSFSRMALSSRLPRASSIAARR